MIPTEKPGTPAELAHHGVKGQKWGVRKSPTSTEIYRARARQQLRVTNALTEKDKTKRQQAVKKANLHPDRVTALRYSKGEKYVLGLLAATGVGTVPIAATAGIRFATRKSVERRISKTKS